MLLLAIYVFYSANICASFFFFSSLLMIFYSNYLCHSKHRKIIKKILKKTFYATPNTTSFIILYHKMSTFKNLNENVLQII